MENSQITSSNPTYKSTIKFKQYIKQDRYEAVVTEDGDIWEKFYVELYLPRKILPLYRLQTNYSKFGWTPWTLKVIELGK